MANAQARVSRYQALMEFMMTTMLADREDLCREVLTYDYYLRENVKSRPPFAPAEDEEIRTESKKRLRAFYIMEEAEYKNLPAYGGYDSRQMSKMTHGEIFWYPVWEESLTPETKPWEEPAILVFDYRTRDPLTYEARTVFV